MGSRGAAHAAVDGAQEGEAMKLRILVWRMAMAVRVSDGSGQALLDAVVNGTTFD